MRTIEKAVVQRARLVTRCSQMNWSQRARAVLPAALRVMPATWRPVRAFLRSTTAEWQIYLAVLSTLKTNLDGTRRSDRDCLRPVSCLGKPLGALANRSRDPAAIRDSFPYAILEEYIAGIKQSAPQVRDHPHVVLLSPGRYNSAHFEHAYLAHQCDFALVEGRDLFVTDDGVFQYSVSGPRAVDVIVRRVDTEFCDRVPSARIPCSASPAW